MTPNEMLAHVRATVPSAYITSTGGNCGAIAVDTPEGQVLVTPDGGPWATPLHDDTDTECDGWRVALHDDTDGGTWLDGAWVRDGDTVTPAGSVPVVVHRLANGIA